MTLGCVAITMFVAVSGIPLRTAHQNSACLGSMSIKLALIPTRVGSAIAA